jgi:hypothetical protein
VLALKSDTGRRSCDTLCRKNDTMGAGSGDESGNDSKVVHLENREEEVTSTRKNE